MPLGPFWKAAQFRMTEELQKGGTCRLEQI